MRSTGKKKTLVLAPSMGENISGFSPKPGRRNTRSSVIEIPNQVAGVLITRAIPRRRPLLPSNPRQDP